VGKRFFYTPMSRPKLPGPAFFFRPVLRRRGFFGPSGNGWGPQKCPNLLFAPRPNPTPAILPIPGPFLPPEKSAISFSKKLKIAPPGVARKMVGRQWPFNNFPAVFFGFCGGGAPKIVACPFPFSVCWAMLWNFARLSPLCWPAEFPPLFNGVGGLGPDAQSIWADLFFPNPQRASIPRPGAPPAGAFCFFLLAGLGPGWGGLGRDGHPRFPIPPKFPPTGKTPVPSKPRPKEKGAVSPAFFSVPCCLKFLLAHRPLAESVPGVFWPGSKFYGPGFFFFFSPFSPFPFLPSFFLFPFQTPPV